MNRAAILPPMTCRKCGASNPVIFLAPVIVTGSCSCICLDCAEARKWLDPDGNVKAGVEL